MKHLTDEQLSARLDGELAAKQAEAVERHLAACAGCRDRLATLAGSDTALARALEHDPGEAYFASFADRVRDRIATGTAGEGAREAADAAPRRAGWFSRPSTLAWAGAAAALVAVGAFALQFATQQSAGDRRAPERPSVVGADRLESRAEAPAEPAARPPAPTAGAPAPAEPGVGEPLPTGTQELGRAGQREAGSARADAEARLGAAAPQARTEQQERFAAPPAADRLRKPAAPSAPATPPATRQETAAEKQNLARPAEQPRLGAAAPKSAVPAPAPAAVAPAAEQVSGVARAEADEAATFRLCGAVTNAQGRALAGATVTVVETGRSVVSGAGGAFCVEAPSAGATLSVLAIGYEEHRATVRNEYAYAPLAITLKSVETLGPGGPPVARFTSPPAPPAQGTAEGKALTTRDAPATSGYKGLVDTPVRRPGVTTDAARIATEAALRARSAPLWAQAATLWSDAASSARTDSAANDALYRAAGARMNAWRLERSEANRRAATAALEALLARAPAGEPRERAEAWRKELAAR